MDQSIRKLRPISAAASLDTDVTAEMLRRATGRPLPEPTPVPQGNLLARALADATDTVTGRTAGHLTYTADSGESITITVDVYLERQIARAVHNAVMEARALAALEARMVAGSVRSITSAGRRTLRLAEAPGGVA